ADHVVPAFAAVARDLQVAIVCPDPDHILVLGRFTDRINRRVHFGGGIVHRHTARLFLFLFLLIVLRQVGRNALPVLTVIAGTKQELRAHVDRSLFVWRQRDRRIPVVTQLLLIIWSRLDVAPFVRASIYSCNLATLIFSVDAVRIGRIGEHPEAVAA